jgi:hypothetical protein
MTIEHKDITDPHIHEIKGASTATLGEIPVADGSGGHSWENLDEQYIKNRRVFLSAVIEDVSAADTVWVVAPGDGEINRVWCVLDTAITVADATISFEINSVAVSGANLVLNFATSGAGYVKKATATANNTATADTAIKISTDGGSTTASKGTVFIEYILD